MKKGPLWALALLLAAIYAGCAPSGAIVSVDGSTSMEKVIGSLGEAFENDHGDISFTYNPTGSGAGIQAVLDGRCDIGLSSRSLTEAEAAQGLQTTALAYDGIAVILHPDNPIEDLSLDTLAHLYTGQIADWKDIGGQAGAVVPIGREAGSGTREGFEAATGTAGRCQYRQELTSTGDIITAVSSNPNALGYASLASLRDGVKAIRINGIMPTEAAIKSGAYAIYRPFLLVTQRDRPLSPGALRFFCYATSMQGAAIITQAGAVAAN